jgi:hypothetical protein
MLLSRLMTLGPTWKSPPPPDQFVHTPAPIVAVKLEQRDTGSKRDHDAANKRLKTGHIKSIKPPANFICGEHLFEPVVPLPQGKPAITTSIMARLKHGIRFPQIPDSTSTFKYICFHSAFPPPHNRCTTSK